MLGSHCTENPPNLSSTSGAGSVQQIGDLQAYVTSNQDSNQAIILISDAFGYESPKLREIADKAAACGYFVVVPDFLHGDPFCLDKHTLKTWFSVHNAEKGCDEALTLIDALKSRGVSKIGVVGYCWGGLVAARLATFDCVQAAVVLHPGVITEEEINEVKVPIAILGAEKDKIAPAEHLKHLGDILSAKSEVDSFVKIYPGVDHGWAVRYDEHDEFAVKRAEEARLDTMNWLNKYIK